MRLKIQKKYNNKCYYHHYQVTTCYYRYYQVTTCYYQSYYRYYLLLPKLLPLLPKLLPLLPQLLPLLPKLLQLLPYYYHYYHITTITTNIFYNAIKNKKNVAEKNNLIYLNEAFLIQFFIKLDEIKDYCLSYGFITLYLRIFTSLSFY